MGAGLIPSNGATLRPSKIQIEGSILPRLIRKLETTRDREIVAECLIAIAKIGKDPATSTLVELIEPHLSRRDPRVRESAILALGITQQDAATTKLLALLQNSAEGQALVGRPRVSPRSRAFAAFGLGCIGSRKQNSKARAEIASALRSVLVEDNAQLDPRVAAIHALGVLKLDRDDSRDRRTLAKTTHALMTLFGQDLGVGAERMQAHAATATAKLLTRCPTPDLIEWTKTQLTRELAKRGGRRSGRRSHHIVRSAILSLGVLGSPVEDDLATDAKIAELLWEEYREGKDEQSRSFALIGLGQMGGLICRDHLLAAVRGRTMQRPWAALGLGILSHERRRTDNTDAEAENIVIDALRRVLRDHKNPDLLASTAIALGLAGADEAAIELRRMLKDYSQRSFLGGYLCTSLALIGDDLAADTIQAAVSGAKNQPKLLRRGAIALALLRLKDTPADLLKFLGKKHASTAQVRAVAPALSRIGDRRAVEPLLDVLEQDALTDPSQSMIALALGGIADKEDLPWYVRFAENANYRASTSALAGSGNGILDRY